MRIFDSQSARGFTLLELLLYLALASALVVTLSNVSIALLRAAHKTEAQQEVTYNGTYILSALEHIASQAYAIEVPLDGATSTTATFRMYDAALDPTTITQSDNVLYITEGGGEQAALQTTLTTSAIEFQNVTPQNGFDSVRVLLTVEASTTGTLAQQGASAYFETTLTLPYTP